MNRHRGGASANALRSAVLMGFAACATTVATPQRSAAQTTSGPCTVSPATLNGADACRKALDLFAFVMPQVGVALASGNPVLGEGGTLGGWGKRLLSVRLTAVDGAVPKNTVPISNAGAATPSDFGASAAPIPVPSADLAVGLFSGVPAGLTNLFGVDAILSGTYLPSVTNDDLRLSPTTANFAFSYGARVGLLQESSLVPGISVSYVRRKVPTMNLDFRPGNDTISLRNLGATTNSLRAVISKRIAIVGLSAGVGRDEIEGTGSMTAVVNETLLGAPLRSTTALAAMRTKTIRSTVFASASFGLPMLRLVGEVGWSGEGDPETTLNTFGNRLPTDGYRYGTLGIAVRF
jgi:hypothetical protein